MTQFATGGYVPGPNGDGKAENLLQQLARQCVKDSERYFPNFGSSPLVHHALALCGETGELANVIKKIDRGSLDIATESAKIQLEGEATDVLIYLLNIFGILGIDPLRAYFKKREFNNERFTHTTNTDGNQERFVR